MERMTTTMMKISFSAAAKIIKIFQLSTVARASRLRVPAASRGEVCRAGRDAPKARSQDRRATRSRCALWFGLQPAQNFRFERFIFRIRNQLGVRHLFRLLQTPD